MTQRLRATAIAALMTISLLGLTVAIAPVGAQQLDNRSPGSDTVAPGDTVEVTVEVSSDSQNIELLTEEIVSGDGIANITDSTSTNGAAATSHPSNSAEILYLQGPVSSDTLTYTVTVADDATDGDTIELSGTILDEAGGETDTGTTTLSVEEPEAGPFNVTNLSPTDPTVAPGDQLTITADVTNTGPAEGATEVRAIVAGTEVANETETIGAGDTTTISFDVTAPDTTGEYTHSVETDDDSLSGTLTVSNDPEFIITGLSPQEPTVGQGDTIDISAQIENTGGSGTQTVSLLVDGTVIKEATAQLDNGGTASIIFSDVATAQLTPGTYTHIISTANDTASGTLTIEASVTTYETSPGTVDTGGLLDAINEWRNEEIDVGLLVDVIEAWRQS